MATVPEFISVAARMILTAISARLAAITLLKKGTSQEAFSEVMQSGVEASGSIILVETSSEVDTLSGLCRTETDDLGAMRAAVEVAANRSVNALVKSTILERLIDMLYAEIVAFRKIRSFEYELNELQVFYNTCCLYTSSLGFAHARCTNNIKIQRVPNFVAVVSQTTMNVPQYGN
jgi:hypothetical protein